MFDLKAGRVSASLQQEPRGFTWSVEVAYLKNKRAVAATSPVLYLGRVDVLPLLIGRAQHERSLCSVSIARLLLMNESQVVVSLP